MRLKRTLRLGFFILLSFQAKASLPEALEEKVVIWSKSFDLNTHIIALGPETPHKHRINTNQETLPSDLVKLSKLNTLIIHKGGLVGSIPESIGSLSALSYLFLSGNKLTGSIPSSLGLLSNLSQLELSSNQLTGEIPESLGNLPYLSHLDLSNNQLTGVHTNLFNSPYRNLALYANLQGNPLTILNSLQTPIDVREDTTVILGINGNAYNPEIFDCFTASGYNPVLFHLSGMLGTSLKALEGHYIYTEEGKVNVVKAPEDKRYVDYRNTLSEEEYSSELRQAIEFIASRKTLS